ncbi:MAG: CopG family transcriptional regulator [Salinisphaeraceae bacterium]|jgi:antitoxin ParD1/3/4|nr:CopG family transcriptional regulator [Salinisphaeraceae bacterium]
MSPVIEKISIALPRQMVADVKGAVEAGEYASNSEVIREALRDWTLKRSFQKQGIEHLRHLWEEAIQDASSGQAVDDMIERLTKKYQAVADKTTKKK